MPGILTHTFVYGGGASGAVLAAPNWDQEHVFAGGANGQLLLRDSTQSDGVRWSDQPAARYLKPSAFSWFPYLVAPDPVTALPVVLLPDGNAFDVATLAPPAGTTYYVGYPGNSDSNDGLTTGTSFGTLAKALTGAGVGTVIVKAGVLLTRNSAFPGSAGTNGHSVTIRSDTPGTPFTLSVHDVLTWTLAVGATNTYKATRSLVQSVWDASALDANGDYTPLANPGAYGGTGDLAAGQWYTDAMTVWVRTADSRNLTVAGNAATVRAYMNLAPMYVTGNVTVYLQDITVEGGSDGLNLVDSGGVAPTVYAKRCAWKYMGSATLGNGVSVQSGTTIFQNCTTARNGLDGFNYHIHNGLFSRAIEIACLGRDNGWLGGDSNNGTTTHDGNSAVRIGGQYLRNNGPNVADVNSGTTSWSVGCLAFGSTAGVGALQNANYQSQCSGVGGMWLDACWGMRDTAAPASYQIAVTSGARAFVRSFSGDLTVAIGAAGQLLSY